jgi:hypothetical protein
MFLKDHLGPYASCFYGQRQTNASAGRQVSRAEPFDKFRIDVRHGAQPNSVIAHLTGWQRLQSRRLRQRLDVEPKLNPRLRCGPDHRELLFAPVAHVFLFGRGFKIAKRSEVDQQCVMDRPQRKFGSLVQRIEQSQITQARRLPTR